MPKINTDHVDDCLRTLLLIFLMLVALAFCGMGMLLLSMVFGSHAG